MNVDVDVLGVDVYEVGGYKQKLWWWGSGMHGQGANWRFGLVLLGPGLG